jgi:hypothetical protein
VKWKITNKHKELNKIGKTEEWRDMDGNKINQKEKKEVEVLI